MKTEDRKLYYSISEVAELTEVKPYVLRFWEKEFPLLKPKKNRGGNRTYQEHEIALINRIKQLLYEEGYTIEGARQKLREVHKEVRRDQKLRKALDQVKMELLEIERLLSDGKDI
ncbi:MAG: MerR family transcriptional regulator [bacterium]